MRYFVKRLLPTICGALACGALLVPAAHADQAIAVSPGPTNVSTYGGYTMWSQYEPGSKSWSLWQRTADGRISRVPVSNANGPFQISLGPDSKGRAVALYTRCRTPARGAVAAAGCDAYRYQTHGGKEQKLSFSARTISEEWPAQWKGSFVFGRVYYKDSGGARVRCDVPYRRAVSGGSSQRMDRGRCGAIGGMAVQGTVVAQTVTSLGGSSQSQVRLLSTRGGPVKVAARQAFGEESKLFGGPSLDATYVFASRYGVNPSPAFVRIKRSGLKAQYVAANTNLAGSIAWPSFTYVETMGGFRGGGCDEINPCRIVRSPVNPFGPARRVLAPQVTLSSPGNSNLVPASQPLALSGTLTSKLVSQGKVTGTRPIAGEAVKLLLAAGPQGAVPYRDTGVSATTAADGSFSLTAPAPIPPLFGYGVTTGGSAPAVSNQLYGNARVTINASASATTVARGANVTFSGSLDPAQPGRGDVKVQRLVSRQCPSATVCNDTWDTVGEATESADGRSFTAGVAVTQSGTYTVVLPFLQNDPSSYNGRSAEIQVTVTG
jgi:hypothetical protein